MDAPKLAGKGAGAQWVHGPTARPNLEVEALHEPERRAPFPLPRSAAFGSFSRVIPKTGSDSGPAAGSLGGALRGWEIAYLFLLVAGLLTAFWLKSGKEYFGHDEFMTAVLAGGSSLPAMLDTIRNGGETNPPLYFILEWLVARGFGTGETAMRMLSAAGTSLSAVVVFFTLRRVVGSRNAALAVGLVFGLSRGVYEYLLWARYYGIFLLLAALMASLFVRINSAETLRRRDVGFVFLVHAAMVYLHLFGALFSGMFLVAQLAMDWLRGRWRWPLVGAVAAAWATFLFWAPALAKQFSVTSSGTWTPRMPFGLFVDEPAMQTPLATVLLLVAALAVLTSLARRVEGIPTAPGAEWTALLVLALAWMTVPVATWAISQVRQPIYMQRYVAPCIVALTLIVAVGLWAVGRLPRPDSVLAGRVPGWLPRLAEAGILGGCLIFQPLRASQDPQRPAAAFADQDFGHPNVPIAFEDSMDFLPRAYYGKGREYLLLIDPDAAAASTGYFTKQMDRLFSPFRAHHPELKVRYPQELPTESEGFLVVHAAHAETFEWILKHRPGFQAERLGAWPNGQEVYWVRRAAN